MSKAIMSLFVCILLISTSIVIAEKNTENKSISLSLFNLENIRSNNPNDTKKWTFMFYDDSDFWRGYHPRNNFSKNTWSGKNSSVIIMEDRWLITRNAKYIYVDEHHNQILLKTIREPNMGRSSTLKNFIEYCKNEYPAERYILAMYDHGMGWNGACIDIASFWDYLTMDEMQKALTEAGGVDLLCFTAPCFMGAVECVYELRDCVDIYIGAEESSSYLFWPYALNSLCGALNETPDISNIALGEKIIEWIEEDAKTNEEYGKRVSMTAIRTDKIEDLIQPIEKFSKYLYENFNKSFNNIKAARNNSKEISHNGEIDLYDFVQKYYDIESDPIICQNLLNITESFNETVIKECHGVGHTGDHGLSIYFPSNTTYGIPRGDYSNCELDFTQDTHWDEFLLKYEEKIYSQDIHLNELFKSYTEKVKSKTKAIDNPFLPFYEQHPYLFPIIRYLLDLKGEME